MLESIALKILDVAIGFHPMVAMVFMVLGVILLICELFVKVTPGKEDDAKWAKWKGGYLGPFINFFIKFAKRKLIPGKK